MIIQYDHYVVSISGVEHALEDCVSTLNPAPSTAALACVHAQVRRVAERAGAHARGVRAGAAHHRVQTRAPRGRLAAARRARRAGRRGPRLLQHLAAEPSERRHSRYARPRHALQLVSCDLELY